MKLLPETMSKIPDKTKAQIAYKLKHDPAFRKCNAVQLDRYPTLIIVQH